MVFHYCQAFVLAVALISSAKSVGRSWQTVRFDLTNTSHNTQAQVTSLVLCILRATVSEKLVNLACFRGPEACTFGYVDVQAQRPTSTPGWTCALSPVCVTAAGEMAHEGSSDVDPDCPQGWPRTCVKAEWLKRKIPSPRTVCSSPFTPSSYGCILVDSSPRTQCLAKQFCQELGAGLASPLTAGDFTTLRSIMAATHGGGGDFWMGVERKSPQDAWKYVRNGRNPKGTSSTDWLNWEPSNGPFDFCARMIEISEFQLGDKDCSKIFGVVCEVYL